MYCAAAKGNLCTLDNPSLAALIAPAPMLTDVAASTLLAITVSAGLHIATRYALQGCGDRSSIASH